MKSSSKGVKRERPEDENVDTLPAGDKKRFKANDDASPVKAPPTHVVPKATSEVQHGGAPVVSEMQGLEPTSKMQGVCAVAATPPPSGGDTGGTMLRQTAPLDRPHQPLVGASEMSQGDSVILERVAPTPVCGSLALTVVTPATTTTTLCVVNREEAESRYSGTVPMVFPTMDWQAVKCRDSPGLYWVQTPMAASQNANDKPTIMKKLIGSTAFTGSLTMLIGRDTDTGLLGNTYSLEAPPYDAKHHLWLGRPSYDNHIRQKMRFVDEDYDAMLRSMDELRDRAITRMIETHQLNPQADQRLERIVGELKKVVGPKATTKDLAAAFKNKLGASGRVPPPRDADAPDMDEDPIGLKVRVWSPFKPKNSDDKDSYAPPGTPFRAYIDAAEKNDGKYYNPLPIMHGKGEERTNVGVWVNDDGVGVRLDDGMFDPVGSPELARTGMRLQAGDIVVPLFKLAFWVHGAGTNCGFRWECVGCHLVERLREPFSRAGRRANYCVKDYMPECTLIGV
jgi:hypothetical protein